MAKRQARPLKNKVAKVPVVMQLEALECGAAALAMVMAYYGKWVPLEQVRLDCGVSRDGSNAKNIYLAAQNYGFDVKAVRTTPEALRNDGVLADIAPTMIQIMDKKQPKEMDGKTADDFCRFFGTHDQRRRGTAERDMGQSAGQCH